MNKQEMAQVVNFAAMALMFAANEGVDIQAVSNEIASARSQGRDGLSDAQLQQLVDQWHASDTREQQAFDKRMGEDSSAGSGSTS